MNKRIKILISEISSTMGGIESFYTNILPYIERDYFQFDFLSNSSNPIFEDIVKNMGCTIRKTPSIKSPIKRTIEIRQILRGDYDIVHINKNSCIDLEIMKEAIKRNCKVILHSHNTAPSKNTLLVPLHFINRLFFVRKADVLAACSSGAAKWMFGNQFSKAIILQNAIDVERFLFSEEIRTSKRSELDINDETFVVGHIGRLEPQKNHTLLLDIFAEIQGIKPNSLLILVGEGSLANDLHKRALELGISKNVRFLGKRSDIAPLLFAMDVFVFPSLYEGFPVALIEAQAAGLPIFVSDAVSKEIEIGENVKWFNSLRGTKYIAEKICGIEGFDVSERKNNNAIILQSPYTVADSAKKLESIYRNLMLGDNLGHIR